MTDPRRSVLFATHFGLDASAVRFDHPLLLEIDADAAKSPDGQIVFLTIVNTLARLTSRLSLQAPDTPLAAWCPVGTSSTLLSRAKELRQALGSGDSGEAALSVIHVGSGPATGTRNIWVTSTGWTAYVSRGGHELPAFQSDTNPAGALVAAHLAAAQVYVDMLKAWGAPRAPKPSPLVVYNVLNHRPEPAPEGTPAWPADLALPWPTVIVGAGAVAHGALHAAATMGLRGEFLVIDPGRFKRSNFERYLLMTSDHAGAKAPYLESVNWPHGLAVKGFEATYRRWSDDHDSPIPVVVSTVDDTAWNQARKDLQTDLPRDIIHAATGTMTLTLGRVRFLEGPCLGCLAPEGDDDPVDLLSKNTGIAWGRCWALWVQNAPFAIEDLEVICRRFGLVLKEHEHLVGQPGKEALGALCGQMIVTTPQGAFQASISFLSGLAGALATIELAKLGTESLRPFVIDPPVKLAVHYPQGFDTYPMKSASCSVQCSHPVLREAWTRQWIVA